MYRLTIFSADRSVYWVESFNDLDAANKWISEQQSRKDWDKNRTYRIDYEGPSEEDKQKRLLEEERIKKAAADLEPIATRLKELAVLARDTTLKKEELDEATALMLRFLFRI